MKYNIDILSDTKKNELKSSNVDELSSTIIVLSQWLNEVLLQEKCFSVIGI